MSRSIESVLKDIQLKKQQIVEVVATSAAKDYAEYQKLCGEIRGLSIAEGYILDLVKLINNGEYEDL
jgi:hypothetical protein